MKEIKCKRWEFYADVEATCEAYSVIKRGGAEECECSPCQNFVVARDRAYPQEVQELFEQLGIDYRKEIEVYHICRTEIGKHLYGGWLHFIGDFKLGERFTVITAVDANTEAYTFAFEEIDRKFQISFTENSGLYWNEFNGDQLIQVEFRVEIPWMIEEIDEPLD
jgi:hypothetical protein